MKAIVLREYHDSPALALRIEEWERPLPNPDEVLVKVKAASLNPIDARMRAGYGRALFSAHASLPIVLGRDFSGIIESVGHNVNGYEVGDEVFGVANPFSQAGLKSGSHSHYIRVSTSEITKKPPQIGHIEAASLPYVALTSYAALLTQLNLELKDYVGKTVLVHAGAGGVGSYAIQFLKALDARVMTTCKTDNVEFVRHLGADKVIDYTQEDYTSLSQQCDVAYDLLGKHHTDPTLKVLKNTSLSEKAHRKIGSLLTTCQEALAKAQEHWELAHYKNILKSFDEAVRELLPDPAARYVSIVSPMMPLTDTHGFHPGLSQFVASTLVRKAEQAKLGRLFNYSFFEPNPEALQHLTRDLIGHKIRPVVTHVIPFEQAAEAHSLLDTGHVRGKIVLTFS